MFTEQELNTIVTGGRDKALAATRKKYPRHVHRISDVGHPCKRYLFYAIDQWDKAADMSLSGLGFMRLGHNVEDLVIDFFNSEVGPACRPKLRILRQSNPAKDKLLKEHNISGTDDGTLAYQRDDGGYGMIGTIDLKSCAPSLFGTYTSLEALRRKTWTTLYLTQIQLYAFANNYMEGYLFFISKQNMFYDWRLLRVPVDFAHVETVLQKCAEVNKSLKAGNPPERLNQPFWCKGCRFETVCLPELQATGEGPILNESEEIDALLERVQWLKQYKKEYDNLYEELKEKLIKGQPLICRNYMVEWKQTTRNVKARDAYSYTVWSPRITAFKEEENTDANDD